ncbi:MAG: hypothetical protein WC533_03055 [Candidatus Pacearchaeota archaeon]
MAGICEQIYDKYAKLAEKFRTQLSVYRSIGADNYILRFSSLGELSDETRKRITNSVESPIRLGDREIKTSLEFAVSAMFKLQSR